MVLTFGVAAILAFASIFGVGITSFSKSIGAPEITIPSAQPAVKNSISPSGSTNWAGYVIEAPAGKISDVQMSWIVPTVSCSFLSGTYAAVWVGIDGAGTNTVEQIGTDSNCGILGASYYAWYEFYPQNSVTISDKVSSGDVISAQVIFSSLTELYTLKITDHAQNWVFQASGTVSGAQESTAEWIIERPTLCSILFGCSLASLSNFGNVFSGPVYTKLSSKLTDTATISGKTGSISSFASVKGDSVYDVTMYSSNSPTYPLAVPSALQNGKSFATLWYDSS